MPSPDETMRDVTSRGRAYILLVEQSQALCLLLKERIEAETGADVVACHAFTEAKRILKKQRFDLAVAARTLPDAANGAIVAVLERFDVPFILLTATFDSALRARYSGAQMVDYFVKDNTQTADMVVNALSKFLNNHLVTVLVVDDSKSGRSRLVSILRQQNFTVLQATGAVEAMAMIEAHPVEIVIVDYYMPGMDGYELIKKIRERHPSDRIRLIGVSSSSDRTLSSAFLKAGASDFLYRPFYAEELQCRMDNHVETLLQIKRLRTLAERDPLTALYNRRAFFERAETMARSLGSTGGVGSVAVLDIDHFKRINDTHGHHAGDRVLQSVARVVEEEARRDHALAARYGGEEFVLMLPGLVGDQASLACERLRQAIERSGVLSGDSEIHVTASIGLAMLEPAESLSNALSAADQMLYLAKAQGRNQVCNDAMFAQVNAA